jgi:hypothetical protein
MGSSSKVHVLLLMRATPTWVYYGEVGNRRMVKEAETIWNVKAYRAFLPAAIRQRQSAYVVLASDMHVMQQLSGLEMLQVDNNIIRLSAAEWW